MSTTPFYRSLRWPGGPNKLSGTLPPKINQFPRNLQEKKSPHDHIRVRATRLNAHVNPSTLPPMQLCQHQALLLHPQRFLHTRARTLRSRHQNPSFRNNPTQRAVPCDATSPFHARGFCISVTEFGMYILV